MKKHTLLESIKRMHQIIGIQPDILIETEINENNPIATEGAKLFAKLFTNLEKALVVGGKNYSKSQVKTIIGKVGNATLTADEKAVMQILAKDLIAVDKALIKRMSSEIFGEMQKLTNKQLRTKYYSEVKAGLRDLLPDTEFNRIIKGVDDKITPKKPSGGQTTPQNPDPTKFTIPGTVEAVLDDVDLVDEVAVMARLKNLFPKAPSSKIQEMTTNLKKSNLLTQTDFDNAWGEAIEGYKPDYKKLLDTPPFKQRAKDLYNGLNSWQKKVFWVVIFPTGYTLLKTIGIPVDKATGALIDMYQKMFKDQVNSVVGDKPSSDGSSDNTGGKGRFN